MSRTVAVALLGPLELAVDGRPVRLAGDRLRATLCRLAVAVPRPVSADELIDAVWGDEPPAEAANALQSLVSRLRRALGAADAVLADARGYRLPLSRDDVDALAFRDLVGRARQQTRSGDHGAALDTFGTALALWRGTALADVADAPWAAGPAAELEHLRLDAVAGRSEAALALGRGEEVITELQRLVEEHPLREDLAGLLISALAQSGRGGEALEGYERVRTELADRLGSDPGPELRALHLRLLRGELESPAPTRRRRPAGFGVPLTSFVGREAELSRVGTSVRVNRLTTVVGPGGAGKTRLASEVARDWAGDHESPAWLVELAPVTAETAVPGAVLEALGLQEARMLDRSERVGRATRDERERLLDAIADSDGLLVIDNCEHLISAVAELVAAVVAAAPGIRVLATSREPLGLTGEVLAPIPPLGLPPSGAGPDQAADYPAVRLFCDRAAAVRSDFVLDPATTPDVITIVRRLDGMPLAIELAVARLRVLPVAEIAIRLSDRFRLLTGGNRTSLPRHRTLRAVVDWSWELLTEPERLLAERLAVFPAGATEESATRSCAGADLPAGEIGELLITLTEKSLLQAQPTAPVRYRMLETIREYGIERLAEQGAIDRARSRHADYFAGLVERLEPVLRGRDQLTGLATLRAEEANIAAARQYLVDSGRLRQSLLMTLAMSWQTMITGNRAEVDWLDQVLEAHRAAGATDEPYLVYAEALRLMSRLDEGTGTGWDDIRPRLVDLYRRLEASGVSAPYGSLQAVAAMLPVYAGLDAEAEVSMARALASPDPWIRAVMHASAAAWAENTGDSDRLRAEVQRAEDEFAQTGDRWGIATVAGTRAQLRMLDGDPAGALEDLRAALVATEELDASEDSRFIRLRIATALAQLGRTDEARRQLTELRGDSETPRRGIDEGLLIDAMAIILDLVDGERDAALGLAADVRRRAYAMPTGSLMGGHAISIALAATSMVYAVDAEREPSQLAIALEDVRHAYPAARKTEDMPIVAQFGFGLAQVARRLGRPTEATEILGAAARLRGGDTPTDALTTRLIADLRAELGDAYDRHYRTGRDLDRSGAVERLDPDRLLPAHAP